MSMVGLTRVASVVEAPSHLEFVSSFFINSEKRPWRGERLRRCQSRSTRVQTQETEPQPRSRNRSSQKTKLPQPRKKSVADVQHRADREHLALERAGARSKECLT